MVLKILSSGVVVGVSAASSGLRLCRQIRRGSFVPHFAIGLEQRAQQVVKLEHLRLFSAVMICGG